LGGAPASEVADADADFKEALFRGTKLGIDLLAGPSIGHLPVLGAALEAECANTATRHAFLDSQRFHILNTLDIGFTS
jgi:hypothetical protein